MLRKYVLLPTLACLIAAAPLVAFAKEANKDSDNFFDIRDEIQEAGDVIQKGADKTAGFFERLFHDDDKDIDLKFHAPWDKK